MTNEQITAKVIELRDALVNHRNFVDSLPNEVVDVLNDSCFYVNGSIDQINDEIFEIENFLERDFDDGSDEEDYRLSVEDVRKGIFPINGTSDEEIEKIRDAYAKEWREQNN